MYTLTIEYFDSEPTVIHDITQELHDEIKSRVFPSNKDKLTFCFEVEHKKPVWKDPYSLNISLEQLGWEKYTAIYNLTLRHPRIKNVSLTPVEFKKEMFDDTQDN